MRSRSGARTAGIPGHSWRAWRTAAVDVAETRGAIVFKADIPELHERTLMISGQRREETESEHEGNSSREGTTGSFTRSFVLPHGIAADTNTADASDGVLRVTAPLPKPTQPSWIEIRGGSGRSSVESSKQSAVEGDQDAGSASASDGDAVGAATSG